jgi:Short C-terminal domain
MISAGAPYKLQPAECQPATDVMMIDATSSATAGSGTPAAATDTTARIGNSRRRKLAVGLLIALGSLMLGISVLATWADRVFLDSTTWADTSAAALQQPEVQTALSSYLVDQVYANVDVPQALAQALPPRAKPLAGPLAVSGQPYIERAIAAGLDRPRVVELWRRAMLRAHAALLKILNGGSGPLSTSNGVVAIDLRPLVDQISSTLTQRTNGAVTLPPDAGLIVLLKSDQLSATQKTVKVMRVLALPLGLLALAVYALAIYLSRARRPTLRAIAIGMLAVGLVLVVVRRLLGDYFIGSLTTLPDVRAAASVTWYMATDRLGSANITLCSVALLLLLGTWLAGPGRRATSARYALTPYLRDPGAAYGAYGLVLLVLLIWAPVNAARDPVMVLIIGVLGAIGVEALRRLVIREFPDATERDLGGRLGAASKRTYASARGGPTPAPPADGGRYAALDQLASLHDRGALNDQEFADEKAELLAKR